MNIKKYFEKHNNRTLENREWESVAQTLIDAKFDGEKKAEWAQRLREKGIHRSPNSAIGFWSTGIRKLMAAAAAVVLMAAAVWFFLPDTPLSSAQQMASQYLEQPFRLNQGSTRGEEAMEKNRGKAYETFETQQYEKSLSYLQIIESEGQAKATDFFQMGLCFMYQKAPDYNRAIKAFNEAHKLDPLIYTDEINWFSGLCYLMKGDETESTKAFQKLLDSPSSRNRDAAKELLRKMDY